MKRRMNLQVHPPRTCNIGQNLSWIHKHTCYVYCRALSANPAPKCAADNLLQAKWHNVQVHRRDVGSLAMRNILQATGMPLWSHSTGTHSQKDYHSSAHDMITHLLHCMQGYPLKKICEYATNRDFTDVIVFNENRKTINGLLLVHLPGGPTAHFKLSSLKLSKDIKV